MAATAIGSLVAHDVNEVFLRVSNRGGYGLALGDNDAGNFPRGTPNRYLFGSGLWIGGIGDVDANGEPDTITTIGYNPSAPEDIEWLEGAVGFPQDDPRFRVLNTADPGDAELFPAEPVADQELFTIYGDRRSVVSRNIPSVPLGVEVRQRSFAFTEPDLATAVFVQWDLLNISDQIRSTGYTIRDLWTGIVLDPDIQVSAIGDVEDDTAAPLTIDGREVLLIWDSDFSENAFVGAPGFLAIVPLIGPELDTTVTQLASSNVPGVLPVPLTDASQYATLAAIPPRTPTIVGPGYDLRALVGWGGDIDLPEGEVLRTAAAFVWADAAGVPSAPLTPDQGLDQDLPVLSNLVAAVRAARAAYEERLAGLPALLDFPGPIEPPPAGQDAIVFQNYPNPFSSSTTVEFRIVEAGEIDLKVYDLTGREVVTLASGPRQPSVYEVVWDGRSASGQPVPAGVYVIRLETSGREFSVRALRRP